MVALATPSLGGGGASIQPPQVVTNGTSATTALGGGSSPSTSGTGLNVASLYPNQPTTGTFTAAMGTAAAVGTATAAQASDVAGMGSQNTNDPTNVAGQLNDITSANSPYMQLARQQGMLSAAQRGLGNSSIAAGNAEAAAVQAAAPLAEQNASEAAQGKLQNSQLETQANEFNAGQTNANQQLDAQLKTQTSQFNASQQQSAGATNAAALNAMREQTQQIVAQMNTQFLSGTMAQQLAGIQGQYSELIAQNQSAAALVQTTLNGMSAALSNPQVNATQAAQAVKTEMTMLNSALGMINVLNGGSPTATPPVSSTAAPGTPGTTIPGVPTGVPPKK